MDFDQFTLFSTGSQCKKIKNALRSNRVCCVSLCSSVDEGNLSFHLFPKAGNKIAIKHASGQFFYCDRRKIWEDRVGDEVHVTKNSMVCSEHFTKQDYTKNSRLKTRNKRLKRTAVPSLHLLTEDSAFSNFNHPKLLGQAFLNDLNNNNNSNKTVGKTAKVQKKKPQSCDKGEHDISRKQKACVLLQKSSSKEKDITSLEEVDETIFQRQTEAEVQSVRDVDNNLLREVDVPEQTNIVLRSETPVVEDSIGIISDSDESEEEDDVTFHNSDHDLEFEKGELDNKDKTEILNDELPPEDDFEFEKVELDNEDKSDILEHDSRPGDVNGVKETFSSQMKDTKEHVDDYINQHIDMVLMCTSFELEIVRKSGNFGQFVSSGSYVL